MRITSFAIMFATVGAQAIAQTPRRPSAADSSVLRRPQSETAAVTRNVEYGRAWVAAPTRHQKSLRLDLYDPGGRSTLRPAFVLIHGGGFRRGDKGDENVADLCSSLSRHGFVCVSINYRMIDDEPLDRDRPMAALDAAVRDAASAADWLGSRAADLAIDTTRIAVGGSSAGATAALHLAYSGTRNVKFSAVIAWSGSLYGAEDMIGRGEPALFIVHGASDSAVAPSSALSLAARAAAVGIRHELHLCTGLGHSVPLDRRPSGRSLHERLVGFLNGEAVARRPVPQGCPH